ncbi:recombinase family protein [Ureibacillus thermophilus]|uniref:Recombinase family protein n=1 Tax=Ureibacillus thermophilus TaxID=367743 RepID=A0A4P6US85_9BACL|nr:recombinase family protein [Ureibacillus thermophilus]QBK25507.1 recombinase family protein [Ureibacillus thermophilus]
MKRVWCLYRVSKKQQVSADEDIPMQKNACHEFVKNKPDWTITNELYEKGVSGWKKTASERDEMAALKEGALKKKFDVLLVFMFDRLGRREDETPVMVNFLIQHGIEVWSVKEGQRKIESHVDKLLNYISFWQSDGESQKTSIRVKEAKKQLGEQGFFQGGTAPIGYKIVETNQPHWKNKDRRLKELVPDEMESKMIKLIFHLYVNKQMGYRKIADYLNEHGFRTRDGSIFVVSTIQRILSNPIYIGYKRYKSALGGTQPFNEKLKIISDELFYQAERIRKVRHNSIEKQDKSSIPRTGKLLFSGLAYCKYCGSKLTSNYLYRTSKNESSKTIIYRYRCPLNKGKLHGSHQQNVWGGKKYDTLIINQLKTILSKLELESFFNKNQTGKDEFLKLKEQNLKNLKKEYGDLRKQQEKLNLEIGKALIGESAFTPEQLSLALKAIEKQLEEKLRQINDLKEALDKERDHADKPENQFKNWEQKFNEADEDLIKAMLSKIIHKVYFGKNEIDIELNLSLSDYLNGKLY